MPPPKNTTPKVAAALALTPAGIQAVKEGLSAIGHDTSDETLQKFEVRSDAPPIFPLISHTISSQLPRSDLARRRRSSPYFRREARRV